MSQMPRGGSGLKSDGYHRGTSFVVDDPAAVPFKIVNNSGVSQTLYQPPGGMNGVTGVFEWIVDTSSGSPVIVHQRFIPGGRVTGTPNQKV